MGALFSRLKTWVSTEDVTYSDLNSEFNNILDNLIPTMIDDYSANTSQMQTTADPGEVGSESLATSLAGELARLRHMIGEITGEDEWYESPVSSLTGLANAIGTGLTDNRLVSGRVSSGHAQPVFLVPNGAARTVKLDGTPTNFIYYIAGVEYTISSDVTLTSLTAAPSSQNTCLVNDANASDQDWTKYSGEFGSEITIDNVGTEITALQGKTAAFKLDNGSTSEYFIGQYENNKLIKCKRGYFFDSSDAAIPRIVFSNNDTITLMKLTWVFAKTDGTLTATYNPPIWSDDEPSSPSIGDYWFDYSANIWKVYGVGSYSAANAILVGVCIQDTTNTVAARSFEFFSNYDSQNTVELIYESATQVKARYPGSIVNVWGETIKNDHNVHTWDMTLDLDTGLVEASSTYYFFYITETGDKVISTVRPHDRREDLQGFYHTHKPWRCVGSAYNNGSSNLTNVESFYKRNPALEIMPSQTAASNIEVVPRIIPLDSSGAAFTVYLPPAAYCRGDVHTYYKTTSDLNAITLEGFGSETINGSTSTSINTQYELLRLISDGSNWIIVERRIPSEWSSSLSWTYNGLGSVGTNSVWWKRIGDTMSVKGFVTVGTSTASTHYIIAPTGITIDSAKYTSDTSTHKLGDAHRLNGSASNLVTAQHWQVIFFDGSDTAKFFAGSATGTVDNQFDKQNANINVFDGNNWVFNFEFAVTGWKG